MRAGEIEEGYTSAKTLPQILALQEGVRDGVATQGARVLLTTARSSMYFRLLAPEGITAETSVLSLYTQQRRQEIDGEEVNCNDLYFPGTKEIRNPYTSAYEREGIYLPVAYVIDKESGCIQEMFFVSRKTDAAEMLDDIYGTLNAIDRRQFFYDLQVTVMVPSYPDAEIAAHHAMTSWKDKFQDLTVEGQFDEMRMRYITMPLTEAHIDTVADSIGQSKREEQKERQFFLARHINTLVHQGHIRKVVQFLTEPNIAVFKVLTDKKGNSIGYTDIVAVGDHEKISRDLNGGYNDVDQWLERSKTQLRRNGIIKREYPITKDRIAQVYIVDGINHNLLTLASYENFQDIKKCLSDLLFCSQEEIDIFVANSQTDQVRQALVNATNKLKEIRIVQRERQEKPLDISEEDNRITIPDVSGELDKEYEQYSREDMLNFNYEFMKLLRDGLPVDEIDHYLHTVEHYINAQHNNLLFISGKIAEKITSAIAETGRLIDGDPVTIQTSVIKDYNMHEASGPKFADN